MTPGLYLKPLPDGEPRLLAQLETWNIFTPLFSPDSQWLAFSILNSDSLASPISPAALNLQICGAIPLPFCGKMREWLP